MLLLLLFLLHLYFGDYPNKWKKKNNRDTNPPYRASSYINVQLHLPECSVESGDSIVFWLIPRCLPSQLTALWEDSVHCSAVQCSVVQSSKIKHSAEQWARLTFELGILVWLKYVIKVQGKPNMLINVTHEIKYPACGRQWISQNVGIVAPINSEVTCQWLRLTCYVSPVTCHISLTSTATATDPPPANSPIMHSRMLLLIVT